MSTTSVTIERNPKLDESEDYYLLRRKGIGFIEQLGSRWWTDYNSHDPGVTILEALCYAITDLGYRTGWNIEDLLAPPPGAAPVVGDQAFFTAREILTMNPLTVNDYRRVLIDLDRVANAWLFCKKCACETPIFGNCEEGTLGYLHPTDQKQVVEVAPQGTYDVLVEMEQDPQLGDLNDRKISHDFIFSPDEVGDLGEAISAGANGEYFIVRAEFRFPEWESAAWGKASSYFDENGALKFPVQHFSLEVSQRKSGVGGTDNPRRWNQWQHVFFAKISIEFGGIDAPANLVLEDVPLRLFGFDEARRGLKNTNTGELTWDFDKFEKSSFETGVIVPFLKKMATVETVLTELKSQLADRRNLCEDFCCVSRVCVEDIAVCADIELAPAADIELVLGNVLFKIEQYFNPGIKFYNLEEMVAEGLAADEIFEGPRLRHGFVKTDELEAAQLKSQVRTSDIINELVEIEGVVAVKSLLLTRYDQDGLPVAGAADRGQVPANADKISASWTLEVSDRCQPRLYVDNSSFTFYKNGLPFKARRDEVQDTLNQLRGQDERLKIRNLTPNQLDFEVPKGAFRSPQDAYPVQYSFPLAYGIGYEGLRQPANEARKAQAKQLKGYLLVFEQLLGNHLAQLANVRQLFSLDETLSNTYFTGQKLALEQIKSVSELLKASLTDDRIQQLAETEHEYLDRRNRFLDHLLARFSESFSDYALAFYSTQSLRPLAQTALIQNKISFLKSYPSLSHDRAKGFNYKKLPQTADNQPGLRKRMARLLGLDTAMEEKIILVEHLLLRPKFPGDALMDVCLDKNCACCGEEDPYSFQLTVVMPGWAPPFDENIEMRRFADRTIRQEMPAHLLAKVCWVSNLNYGEGWEQNLLNPLQKLLVEKGLAAGNVALPQAAAKSGATIIYEAASTNFNGWYEALAGAKLTGEERKTQLAALFAAELDFPVLFDLVTNFEEIGGEIIELLSTHFAYVAGEDRWFHYDEFRRLWDDWLLANQAFDWCEERVARKVELAIQAKMPNAKQLSCRLMARFGDLFSAEVKKSVQLRKPIAKPRTKVASLFKTAFSRKEFAPIVALPEADLKVLIELVSDEYASYVPVSTKLWALVQRLAKLQSIYPPATLHDCDDGNDENPVRLGSTMLGG